MKRSVAAAIALALGLSAYAQMPVVEDFGKSFTDFAGDLAGSLAVNSTIGSNWSDAYVGGFPHFGVGFAMGAAFTGKGSSALFDTMGVQVPSAFKSFGVPIPAVIGTFKIGIPFLPIDVGIKGGFIPSSVGAKLDSLTGVSVDYKNIGLQVRYALVKQNLVMPNVSIGAAYYYQKGSVAAPTGVGAKNFSITTDQGATTIGASDPKLALGWTSNVFDFTAQVSKQFLVFVPYLGAGLSMGKSTVTGGVSSDLTTDYPGGVGALNNFLATVGGPNVDTVGFTYTTSSNKPVIRLYGGLSFRLLILDFDLQALYVPAVPSLGASLTTRVQI
jgi:hypothetical protein